MCEVVQNAVQPMFFGLPVYRNYGLFRICGYRGAFIIEDGELAEKLREKYASKNVKK